MNILRWCIRIALLVTFFLPFWYVPLLCVAVGLLAFDFFWEGLLFLLIYDLLFGVPLPQFSQFPFALTAAGLIVTGGRYVVLKFLWRRPPVLPPLSKVS